MHLYCALMEPGDFVSMFAAMEHHLAIFSDILALLLQVSTQSLEDTLGG